MPGTGAFWACVEGCGSLSYPPALTCFTALFRAEVFETTTFIYTSSYSSCLLGFFTTVPTTLSRKWPLGVDASSTRAASIYGISEIKADATKNGFTVAPLVLDAGAFFT